MVILGTPWAQATTAKPPLQPIVVITREQAQVPFKGTVSVEELQATFYDDFYETEIDGFAVYVAHSAFPITRYKATLKWIADLQNTDDLQFNCETEIGKSLFQMFQGLMPGGVPEAKSGEKFMDIQPGFIITDPSGKIPPQQNSVTPKDKAKLAAPVRKPLAELPNQNEIIRQARRSDRVFPTLHDNTELVMLDVGTIKSNRNSGRAFAAAGTVIKDLGQELADAQRDYVVALDNLTRHLLTKTWGDFNGKTGGSNRFNEFPKQLKEYLQNLAEHEPQRLGFQTTSDAHQYLDSNPELKLEFYFTMKMNFCTDPEDPNTKTGISISISPKPIKN